MTDDPDQVDLETPDLAARNRAALDELFPGVASDGVLDAAKLGELLALDVAQAEERRERYGLQWAGKQDAVRSLLTPSRATLVPDLERSVVFDKATNVFIEGDNLEVLKLLQKAYNDQIKLIYIDPPYNTGNDFIYNDDFADGLRGYLGYTGQLDEAGNRISADVDTGGRRHSRWLSMMYPRLLLARNLLTQDGILFVSIDDNEVSTLRLMLDEVFGPENFVATFVWVSNIKGRQISGAGPAGTKEYIHVYARNKLNVEDFRASASFLKKVMPTVYKGFNYELKRDEHGPYVTKNELYNTNSAFNEVTRPNLVYDIYYNPDSGEIRTEPVSSRHLHEGMDKIAPKKNNNGVNKYHAYRWSKQKVQAESYDLDFRKSGSTWRIYTKVRDVDSTSVKDLFMDVSTNNGSADLESIGISPAWFDYPKPVGLLQILVDLATDKDSIVLDFFAGSGSTAHAVAMQNARDGGSRRSLMVTLPEPLPVDSDARAAGLEYITDITYKRLVALSESVEGAASRGLRVVSLAQSRFRTTETVEGELDLASSTLAAGLDDIRAVAAEVLLKEGVRLDAEWLEHEFGTVTVQVSGGVAVVVGKGLDVATAEKVFDLDPKPRVVVFLEDELAGQDALKANLVANARSHGITVKTV